MLGYAYRKSVKPGHTGFTGVPLTENKHKDHPPVQALSIVNP